MRRLARPSLALRRAGLVAGIVAVAVSLPLAAALASFTEETNTKVVADGTLTAPTFGEAVARCTGDKHVAFGGFKLNTNLHDRPNIWPYAMGPEGNDVTKWSFLAGNRSAKETAKMTSIAYCAGGKKPKVVKDNAIILQETEGSATATCPNGKVVVGGGWSVPKKGDTGGQAWRLMPVMKLESPTARTWEVTVYNERDSQQQLTAIALCGSGPAAKAYEKEIQLKELTSDTATAKCPANKEVLFGGFRGSYYDQSGRNAFVFGFERPSESKIVVTGEHNYTPAPGKHDLAPMAAIAYCR